jgi:hypothetical protein
VSSFLQALLLTLKHISGAEGLLMSINLHESPNYRMFFSFVFEGGIAKTTVGILFLIIR